MFDCLEFRKKILIEVGSQFFLKNNLIVPPMGIGRDTSALPTKKKKKLLDLRDS